MTDIDPALWPLEHGFWTSGSEYYRRHLSHEVLMVFPGMVLDRDAAIAAIERAPRWATVAFEDPRTLRLAADAVALQYRARAQREGQPQPYRALVTSVYLRRDGTWFLAVHQQTTLA